MKLITKQDVAQLEDGEVIAITADGDQLSIKLEVVGDHIQIEVYKPPYVKAKILV